MKGPIDTRKLCRLSHLELQDWEFLKINSGGVVAKKSSHGDHQTGQEMPDSTLSKSLQCKNSTSTLCEVTGSNSLAEQ